MSTSLLSEFTIGYEEDPDDNTIGYYLNHRACATIELPFDSELPADSTNLEEINKLIYEHMAEYHNVKRFNPLECPSASEHLLVDFCGNCGYSNKG